MSKLTNGSLKHLIKQVIKEEAELENLVEASPNPTDPAQIKRMEAGQPYKVNGIWVVTPKWLWKNKGRHAQVKDMALKGQLALQGGNPAQTARMIKSGEWDAAFGKDVGSKLGYTGAGEAGMAEPGDDVPHDQDPGGEGPPSSLKPKAKKAKRGGRGGRGGRGVRFTGAGKKAIGGVKQLQAYLFSKGFGGKNRKKFVDGVNGPGTLKALIAFQKAQKTIKVDGVVGKETVPLLLPKSEAGNVKLQKDRAAQDPSEEWGGVADKATGSKGRKFTPDDELDPDEIPGKKGADARAKEERERLEAMAGGPGRLSRSSGPMRENNITKTQRKPNKMINEKKLLNVIKRVVREEMQTLKEGPLPGDLSEPVAGGEPSPWPARPGKLAKKKKRVKATRTGRAALADLAQGPENWIATLQRLLWPYVQDSLPGDITIGEFVDGRNGPMTAIALQTFQEDHGETGDAIVGPATMAVLSDAAAEGGQSASYDVSAEEDDLEAVAQGVALPEGRVHNLFRKELLEEACGVPAKRYKIRRR